MRLREIKQHNVLSILVIFILLLSDLFSYYISILVIKSQGSLFDFNYLLLGLFILFFFYFFDRYNPSSMQSRAKEIKIIFRIIFILYFLFLSYEILFTDAIISELQKIIFIFVIFLFLAIFLRLLIRTIQRQLLHYRIGLRKTIIIGSTNNAVKLIQKLNGINSLGYDIKGYFSDLENSTISENCKYLGRIRDVQSFVSRNKIDEIIIAMKNDKDNTLLNIISELKQFDVCIKIIPDLYDMLVGYAKMHNVTGMSLIDINPYILTEIQSLLKRSIDFFGSLIGLIVLSPLFLIVSIIIKLSSKGPIIFKQERIGLNEKAFMVHKFRTMVLDSEKDSGPVWAAKNDPRITKVGNILRKTRLDEFPQLYDVLIGNMSIVGPRPERDFFISKLKDTFPYYARRLNVRPGITGWAQVMGSYDTDIENVKHKLKLDFYYIENMSIWLDIKIMIITVWVILRGKGQ